MIWQRLSRIWQTCIEGAWTAYCHGSLPHGAVITDAEGNIVAQGRNRVREKIAEGREFASNRLAHAEMNALFDLDWYGVNVYGCELYSTIEPCLMCISAVRMAHMKEVHYATPDGGAGGTSLIDKTPFFKEGNIHVVGPEDRDLEIILMAIQVEATLSQLHPGAEAWNNLMAASVPQGLKLGQQLFANHSLQQWKEEGKEAAFVIDQIHEQLSQLS